MIVSRSPQAAYLGLTVPPVELLVPEPQVVALRGRDLDDARDDMVVEHMGRGPCLQERGVLLLGALGHAVDHGTDQEDLAGGLPHLATAADIGAAALVS